MSDSPAAAVTLLDLLDIRELSALTHVCVPTLRRWVHQGRIPFLQPAGKGGKLLFGKDAVAQSVREEPPIAPSDKLVHPKAGRKPRWIN